MTISQFSWARFMKVTSYINGLYLFWYQERGCPYLYTLNLGLYDLLIQMQQPPLNSLGKTLRRTRVKS